MFGLLFGFLVGFICLGCCCSVWAIVVFPIIGLIVEFICRIFAGGDEAIRAIQDLSDIFFK